MKIIINPKCEVVNETGKVMQTTNYYPYGNEFCDGSCSGYDLQPYKYNGKELDRMHGLNALDYGTRMLSVALPVWDRVDPMAEKYYHISPYAYCAGNPVNYVDKDGRFATKWGAAVSRFISCAHLQNVGPIQYNPDATNPNYRYTYNTYSYENGDYVITAHHKMSKNFAESMQDVGDVLSYAGYGLTLSVVGAEIGIPMAEVGGVFSGTGDCLEIGIDALNGDNISNNLGRVLVEIAVNRLVKTGAKKAAEVNEVTDNVGTEIVTQGAGVKVDIAEKCIEEINNKRQQEIEK